MAETRRQGESIQQLNSGNVLYIKGNENKSQGGVGFLVHKNIARNVVEFKGASERVAMIVIRLNSKYMVKIIQAYAPTSAYDDEVVEVMYDEINELLDSKSTHYTMVMGDFNAKIGKQNKGENSVMGKRGTGNRNERGDRLIEFATSKNLYIANGTFQKKEGRKWTWKSPDGSTRNEIDFIMTNKKDTIENLMVLNRVNTGSDHRMVRCRVNFRTQVERVKLVKPKIAKIDYDALKTKQSQFQLEVKNRFGILDTAILDIDNYNRKIL